MRRLWTVTHRSTDPTASLLPSISKMCRDSTTSSLLATWTSLSPTLQVRPFSQRGTIRPWHRLPLYSEMEPSPRSCFSTCCKGKRLRQAYGGLLLNLCQRPVYMAIQASLTRRNHILETMKKGEV